MKKFIKILGTIVKIIVGGFASIFVIAVGINVGMAGLADMEYEPTPEPIETKQTEKEIDEQFLKQQNEELLLYFNEMKNINEQTELDILDFADLNENLVNSQDWVDKVQDKIKRIRTSCKQIENIYVPESVKKIHKTYLDSGITFLKLGLDFYEQGMSTLSAAKLEDSTILFASYLQSRAIYNSITDTMLESLNY